MTVPNAGVLLRHFSDTHTHTHWRERERGSVQITAGEHTHSLVNKD